MNEKTKILIVEHDPNDIELIQYELKKGGVNYITEVVQHETTYRDSLQKFAPGIILCDYSLPSFDGPSAFKMRQELAPDTPFIFVSGHIGEENSIEFIKNGLTDYVLKDKLFTLTTKVLRALKEAKEKQQKIKTGQELKQSERQLARAQQLAHTGSWELDFRSNILVFSDEACRIYGFHTDKNRLLFDTWATLIHPDDLTAVLQTIKDARASLKDSFYHHRIVRKDGAIRHIYSESKFDFDENGKPTGMYGIASDETEKKLAEEQAEFDRNNINALLNNTNDLMWSVDRDFNLITSNQRFDELAVMMTGKAIDKGGNILASGFHPKENSHYSKFYQRAFEGEIFIEIEYTQAPAEKWSEISFYPIRNGAEIIGTACHSHDITDRKKAKLKLEQQNEKLTKTNSELDRFVYSTSHDLRSPLTSILGLVGFIEEETKEPDTLEHTAMIRSRINRLDEFIKNIISYSRNNRTELKVQKISLLDMVNSAVASLVNLKEVGGINFIVDINEGEEFYSDILRFNTVLENLISNAIKYHKKNGAGRYVGITGKTGKENLHFSIEDNGIGISRANLSKIFDMFFRISGETDGSGVGLYIVKETIEKLRGGIEVHSEEGKGTKFTLTIKNLSNDRRIAGEI